VASCLRDQAKVECMKSLSVLARLEALETNFNNYKTQTNKAIGAYKKLMARVLVQQCITEIEMHYLICFGKQYGLTPTWLKSKRIRGGFDDAERAAEHHKLLTQEEKRVLAHTLALSKHALDSQLGSDHSTLNETKRIALRKVGAGEAPADLESFTDEELREHVPVGFPAEVEDDCGRVWYADRTTALSAVEIYLAVVRRR
jgi:hypothetical protein